MSNINSSPNNLIHSKSPYLLQHAYNPVNWEQWDPQIWEKAVSENKLVLISIGYSTCHWCHVMERESFEDWETAEIMNQHLVSIKVDREERPDIDMVYMDFCQQMTGRGGWPLNVICLPNGKPVYAGTYFPKKDWQQLIIQLDFHYKSEPQSYIDYSEKFMQQMEQSAIENDSENLPFYRETLVETFENFISGVDWEHGGMNRVPKFMMPLQLEYALEYEKLSKDERAKEYLHLTLLKMGNGGIFDALRGGFFRYSTDRFWFAPHFEKMLYDNTQLASVYCKAFAWSQADIYKSIAIDILSFIERELSCDIGGYYSALDADTNGEEGSYYVFNFEDIEPICSKEEIEFLTVAYNFKKDGNWEHGQNILNTAKAPLEVLRELNLSAEQYHEIKQSALEKLWKIQQQRNRPDLDYKVILSWNALMLSALKDASLYIDSQKYIPLCYKLANYLWFNFVDVENKSLKRICTKGESYGTAFLEDFAILSKAYLDVYQISLDEDWLIKAKWLADLAIDTFYDGKSNRFYFALVKQTELIVNKIDTTDDVIGSSGSYMARVLLQLSTYFSNKKYATLAESLIQSVFSQTAEHPSWYSQWASIIQERTLGPVHVSISPRFSDSEIQEFQRNLPSWVLLGKTKSNSEIEWLNNETNSDKIQVCAGTQCFEPVETFDQALELIEEWISLY